MKGARDRTEPANFFLFRWEHLIYQLAGHDDTIEAVFKRGRRVAGKK